MRKPINSREQLGTTAAISRYMGLGVTYIQGIKRVAESRHTPENPAPFLGMLTSVSRLESWLERNRDFRVRLAYRKTEKQIAA